MTTPAPSQLVLGCAAAPSPPTLTRRARQVLDVLTDQPRPVTAQQLYVYLRGEGSRIGLTTVYRALHAVVDAQLVHEFRRHEESTFRACSPTEHIHLICAHCGSVEEHRPATLSEAFDEVRAGGFQISAARVEVYGLCGQCDPPVRTAT